MVEFSSREHLQPSLLDRLTDNAPDQTREGSDNQVLSMSQLRQSVLRDLSWLFATTRLEVVTTEDLPPYAAKSVINYGLPGFTGLSQASERSSGLEAAITEAIRTFEPRILSETLRVRLRGKDDDLADGALVFEIQGELWAQPVPVRIILQTTIDPQTQAAAVVESRNRG